MKLNAPTQTFFLVAVILAALGLIGKLGIVAAAAPYAFWLLMIGFVVLVISVVMKGA